MTTLEFIGKLQKTFWALWGKVLMILLRSRKLKYICALKLLVALLECCVAAVGQTLSQQGKLWEEQNGGISFSPFPSTQMVYW